MADEELTPVGRYRKGSVYLRGKMRPVPIRRLLAAHKRWLTSDGRKGKKLELHAAMFFHCKLDGLDFSKADIDSSWFQGGSVKGSLFRETELQSTVIEACDLAGADFSGAYLKWNSCHEP